MDHPVLAAGLEQGVAAPEPLAAEGADHLVVAKLLRLVGAAVPDLHVAGAVLSRRYVPLEVQVLERVVLDVDGEMVALGIGGDPLGHRPRHQRAVALQAQVPVEAARVVLLDHEAGLGGARAGAGGVAGRLGRAARVAFVPVTS